MRRGGLPWPPGAQEYYDPAQLQAEGADIGVESLGGWTLKLFPKQLRRHLVLVGMTGSGKTNLLQVLAMNLAEIDRPQGRP